MSSVDGSTSGTNPSADNSFEFSSAQLSGGRGKSNPAWDHCRVTLVESGKPCLKVPPDVCYQMNLNLQGIGERKKRTQQMRDNYNSFSQSHREHEEQAYGQLNDDDHVEKILSQGENVTARGGSQSVKGRPLSLSSKKGKKTTTIGHYFMPRTTSSFQPTLKSVLQGKETVERCDLAIMKWMIDASIPFNAVNSMYYQPALDAIISMGLGYKGPNYHSVRGCLLSKTVQEVKTFVDSFRATWRKTGCTIIVDGWSDQTRRSLINFLVYCPRGTVFLKSVDASETSKTVELLSKLIKEVVLFVGPENVVHIVTDNTANYVAAGRLLEQEFQTLFWSPCAAHCINLILQDIGKLTSVSKVVVHASKITKYVYNHCYPLFLMRKFTSGREIFRPASTRFATNFITLQSILMHKDELRAMVTSKEWTTSAYAKESKGKKFVDDVLNSHFWNECATIVQLTEPLVRVLRIVDSDDRPSMGYLYEAIHKAREEMIRRFKKMRVRVQTYLNIIDARWDLQLHKKLHAAGFWLNPRFQYDSALLEKHNNTVSGLLDVIEKYAYGNPSLQSKLTSEMKLFRNAEKDFGRISAINDRNHLSPDEWWITYGSYAPNLQKLAIRVLSQTCGASGCERNLSVFEHIHSKKRNRLEHQRLNDLVYVHYNLRLQQKNYFKGQNYDPIDLEVLGGDNTWVLLEEPTTLTNEELDIFHRDLAMCTIQDNTDDGVLNLDEYIIGDDGDDDIGNDEVGTSMHNDSAVAGYSFDPNFVPLDTATLDSNVDLDFNPWK